MIIGESKSYKLHDHGNSLKERNILFKVTIVFMFRIKEITALKQNSLNVYGTLRFINERKIYCLCLLVKSWNG